MDRYLLGSLPSGAMNGFEFNDYSSFDLASGDDESPIDRFTLSRDEIIEGPERIGARPSSRNTNPSNVPPAAKPSKMSFQNLAAPGKAKKAYMVSKPAATTISTPTVEVKAFGLPNNHMPEEVVHETINSSTVSKSVIDQEVQSPKIDIAPGPKKELNISSLTNRPNQVKSQRQTPTGVEVEQPAPEPKRESKSKLGLIIGIAVAALATTELTGITSITGLFTPKKKPGLSGIEEKKPEKRTGKSKNRKPAKRQARATKKAVKVSL